MATPNHPGNSIKYRVLRTTFQRVPVSQIPNLPDPGFGRALQPLLPKDLLSFLTTGDQLHYDHSKTEPGRITLFRAEELRVGSVYAAAHSPEDPNHGRSGVYRIPAISLVKSCERYDPDHLLTYLVVERVFAMFDADHARITVFNDASWNDIQSSPALYLNALWEPEPSLDISRDDHPWWEQYAFVEGAFD